MTVCAAHARPGYVGIAQMVHVPAGFLVSTLDSLLIKRGAHALTVRRAMTTVASCLEATCAVAYALASTPLRAAVALASAQPRPLLQQRCQQGPRTRLLLVPQPHFVLALRQL